MAIKKIAVPRTLGFGAGLLALVLVVYSAVGAVWGLSRPTITGTLHESGGYTWSKLEDTQFDSYITFAITTGLIAVVLGLFVYLRAPRRRTAWTLVWLAVVCGAGALAFYYVGGVTAPSMPQTQQEQVTFAPSFAPGVALLAAPFMAAFSYWSALFVGGVEDWNAG